MPCPELRADLTAGQKEGEDRNAERARNHGVTGDHLPTLVALGGTGQADPGWAQLPDWRKYSQALTDSSVAALSAARAKDFAALFIAALLLARLMLGLADTLGGGTGQTQSARALSLLRPAFLLAVLAENPEPVEPRTRRT